MSVCVEIMHYQSSSLFPFCVSFAHSPTAATNFSLKLPLAAAAAICLSSPLLLLLALCSMAMIIVTIMMMTNVTTVLHGKSSFLSLSLFAPALYI